MLGNSLNVCTQPQAVEVCQKDRSNNSRFEFRKVAREVTRELYDIPEDNKAVFAYPQPAGAAGNSPSRHSGWPARGSGWRGRTRGGSTRVSSTQRAACGVLSMSLANTAMVEPDTMFDCDFYHHVTFLFVKPDHQKMGVGRLLVQTALKLMADHAPDRPVRVESALGAVRFFEKLGFVRVGEPYETAYAGSRLFRCIVNMQHAPYQTDSDTYPT